MSIFHSGSIKYTQLAKLINSIHVNCNLNNNNHDHDYNYLLNSIDLINNDNDNQCDCEKKMSKDDKKRMEILSKEIKIFDEHNAKQEAQRATFNKNKEKVKQGELVVVVDYKENLRLGGGPVEVSQTYYHKSQRTVLGFVIYYSAIVDNRECVKKHNYIYISEQLTKDSSYVIDCMKHMVNDVKNKYVRDLKKITLWTDCGRHFRSAEQAHCILRELPATHKCNSTWSLFVEGHGKSPCDSTFSLISRLLYIILGMCVNLCT